MARMSRPASTPAACNCTGAAESTRELMAKTASVPKTIPRVPQANPHLEWITACHGGPKPGSNFDYAGPLTESVLLGSVAVRFPNTTLEWNAAKLKFTNVTEANAFIHRPYRKGWEVKGL